MLFKYFNLKHIRYQLLYCVIKTNHLTTFLECRHCDCTSHPFNKVTNTYLNCVLHLATKCDKCIANAHPILNLPIFAHFIDVW